MDKLLKENKVGALPYLFTQSAPILVFVNENRNTVLGYHYLVPQPIRTLAAQKK